jgi:DNA-binding LacI/PurR family transcriptional regulator
VQVAIKQLNYHPNHVARSLKTSRTRTLGIIVPDLTISFFPHVIRGAEAAAAVRGYSVIAVSSDDDGARQKELLSLLRSQRVEGILLAVAAAPTPVDQVNRMVEAGIRMVCLDRIPDRVPVDSVCVDDVAAARLGTDHLLEMGHRRIAIVTGPLTLKNERQRVLGFSQALEGAGVAADPDLVWNGTLRPDDVAALVRERLCQAAPRPDALISTNAPTGLGVLRALHSLGLETPRDIAFLTFDELTVDDLFRPRVTTVLQPAYDIGFRAAEILLDRLLTHSKPEPIAVRLPATLKVRESSQRPRSAS